MTPKQIANTYLTVLTTTLEIDSNGIFSKSRRQEHLWPRQVIQDAMRRNTELSLRIIGDVTGDFDHATIRSSCRNVRLLMEVDRPFKAKYAPVIRLLDAINLNRTRNQQTQNLLNRAKINYRDSVRQAAKHIRNNRAPVTY